MPEMLTMGRRTGEFLVGGIFAPLTSCSNEFADITVAMASGTPVAKRASDKAIVPWDTTAAAGSGVEVFYGFLHTETSVRASAAFVPVMVITNGPQAISTSFGRVPFIGAITKALLTAAANAKGFTIYD